VPEDAVRGGGAGARELAGHAHGVDRVDGLVLADSGVALLADLEAITLWSSTVLRA
jgi:hypothetical protein